jgi:sirohydrochlorin ferrochelatase
MKILLIVAHGSRQEFANQHLKRLTADIGADVEGRFDKVQCAFLQFNGPFVIDTIAELVAEGATQIVLFPYFLSEGSHVTSDIPGLVKEAKRLYAGVIFEIAPMLGEIQGLKELILGVL